VAGGLVARVIAGILLGLLGWQVSMVVAGSGGHMPSALVGFTVGALLGLCLAPYLVARPYHSLYHLIETMPGTDLLAALMGLILGLLVAALISYPFSFLPMWIGHTVPAIAAIACAYLGISIAMMHRAELAKIFPVRKVGQPGTVEAWGKMLIDTSAIIDGRIADLMETGFLHGTLIVPQFVLGELQHIADSPDPLRRNRGRRGLELLNRLQKETPNRIEIADLDARDVPEVDGKLVKVARALSCPVVTNDFNLNRVAGLQGVRVLNINQLANALKPMLLPGEEMTIRVIQEGKEYNQGLAYLDDGTMIVVENGRPLLNHDIDVVVTRVLQTAAGRMIFAHPKVGPRA
jgi:uncharacterized protein YacL